jgi:hypothetical protein
MLDGKVSIQHWGRKDVFLPFDALGTWALVHEIDAAKKVWSDALRWTKNWDQTIPEHYVECIMVLLHQVPWKEYIKGLGSGLTVTDMVDFLLQE